MADELNDTIHQNAQGSAKATGDAGSIEQLPLPDQIDADRYFASKEASAQATRLANHTTTLAHEYARQGRDWEEALRQRAKELALMAELGLTPAQVQPTSEPQEEEPSDEQGEIEEQAT